MSSYISVTSGGVRWKVLPDFRLLFEFGAFADLPKLLARGTIVRDLRTTRLFEVTVVDLIFYVKVFRAGNLLSRFWTWVHGHRARREFDNCLGAVRRGVQVVPLTAVGERGAESYVVSQVLDGWTTIEELLLYDDVQGRERREMMFQFGVWTRQVHDSGVWQRDVHPAHVLIKPWGDALEFRLFNFEGMRLQRRIPEEKRLGALAKLNEFPKLSKTDRLRFLDGYVHKYPDEARDFRGMNEKLLRLREQQAEKQTVRLAMDCVQDNRNFGPFATEHYRGYYRRRRPDGEELGIDLEEVVRLSEGGGDETTWKKVPAKQALYAWKQANVLVRDGGPVPMAVLVVAGAESGYVVYRREDHQSRIGFRG